MRLEDMLKNVSGITNKVIKENCWEGQFNVLEGIQALQSKVNEIIVAINDGIIKGDKGDTPNVQVGETSTLEPNSNATVSQTGDILNPIFNFGIPKGEKGDKGDTGKSTESIQDNVISSDTCFSSEKTLSLFNDLKNVQGVKYVNNDGYQVCKGTQNGVVKDLKIYGKSLVNICTNDYTKSNVGIYYHTLNSALLSAGDTLTIKPFNNSAVSGLEWALYGMPAGGSATLPIIQYTFDFSQRSLTLPSGYTYYRLYVRKHDGTQYIDFDISKIKICVVVGKGTIGGYFEGIASVGNGNEIEVLSRKEDGNLFDGTSYINGGISYVDSKSVMLIKPIFRSYVVKNIEPNTRYFVRVKNCGNRFGIGSSSDYSTTEQFLLSNSKVHSLSDTTGQTLELDLTTGENDKYLFIYTSNNGVFPSDIDIIVNKGVIKPNSVFISGKKTILFKDTDNTWKPVLNLRGIDENNCDIVDSVNNKLDVKYIDKIVDGTENITIMKTKGTNTLFKVELNVALKPNAKILCDKYKTISYYDNFNSDVVGVSSYDLQSRTYIAISDISSTVEDFKNKLKINNLNLILEVNNPKSYEINPLFPNSYENETMILIESKPIRPTSEFYIDSNLGSLQLETLDRLSRIEDTIYKSNVAILRGDFRTLAQMYYPNDFIKKEELPHE